MYEKFVNEVFPQLEVLKLLLLLQGCVRMCLGVLLLQGCLSGSYGGLSALPQNDFSCISLRGRDVGNL